jgi:copper resistance protein D
MFELLVVTRWIYFASVFVLFGGPLFWFYESHDGGPADGRVLPLTLAATLSLLRIAAPVAVVSGIAWLLGILANMAGVVDADSLHLFFFATQFGPVALLRLILFVATIVAGILPLWHRTWFLVLVAIGAGLLVSQAWFGHAAEGGASATGAVMIAVYAIHLLAAAAWVGGLPVLLLALREIARGPQEEAVAPTLAILSRYSLMAMVAVTLIVVSGIANAGFRVAGSFGKLFWTDYGLVLGAKLVAVALMLALAYFNRFIAMPRLRTAPKGVARIARMRASITLELVLGVAVLGIAAVLGITPPPQ